MNPNAPTPMPGGARAGTGRTSSSARAFTLVELVCSLTVIVVLAAIAVPRYAASLAHYRIDAAARRVEADLAWARESAKATSSPRSITFNPALNSYRLNELNDPDRGGLYTVSLLAPPYQVELISADFGGSSTLTFNGFGVAASGGAVVLRSGRFGRIISLDAATGATTVTTTTTVPMHVFDER